MPATTPCPTPARQADTLAASLEQQIDRGHGGACAQPGDLLTTTAIGWRGRRKTWHSSGKSGCNGERYSRTSGLAFAAVNQATQEVPDRPDRTRVGKLSHVPYHLRHDQTVPNSMPDITRWPSRLAFVLLAMLLSACATAPSVGIEDPDAKRAPDAGYVAVQVVSNAETLGSGPLRRWNALFIIGDGPAAEPLYLPSLESADASTSVFVGALAPGRYRLLLLQAFEQIGDYTYRSRAAVPPFIGTFEIRTNHLTDLKTLVAQPLMPKSPSPEQTFDFVMTRTDSGDDLERFVRHRLPREFAGLAPERLGWAEDPFGELRAELYREMVAHGLPRQVIRLEHQPAYDLFGFGRLGRYYLRDRKTQTWSGASLPRPIEIFAATEHGGGIVMAGERSSVFRLDPANGSLTELPSPDVTALAWDVEVIGKTLLVTTQTQSHWVWYSSTDDGQHWREEHRESRKQPGVLFSVNAPSQLLAPSGELTVWIEKTLLKRAPTGIWTASKAKTEWVELIAQPNGILVGLPYDWWNGVGNTQFSRDGGETWTITESGKWGAFGPQSGSPYLFSDESLLVTGKSAEFKFGLGWQDLPEVPLHRLYPGKKSEGTYGSVVYGCDRLRGNISTDEEIFVLCKFGQLYVSRDQGKTFTLQFDPSLTVTTTDALVRKHLTQLGRAPRASSAGQ